MKQGMGYHALFVLAGIFLVPGLIGTGYTACAQIFSAGGMGRNGWMFLAGIGLYLAIHLFLYKPITVHVFGHEMTHVLWAWLFGGEVKQFRASRDGGRVIVTKTNFLIRLAPYFFPLYSIAAVCVYGLVSLIAGHHRWFIYLVFVLGFCTGFHICMTSYSLRAVQTDLTVSGYFFSILFILIMNIILLVLLLSIVIESISFLEFLQDSFMKTAYIYSRIFKAVTE
jgi:hypothetical protein